MKSFFKKCLYSFCVVITIPLVILYRLTLSEDLFAGQGQWLSLIPGKLGSYVRIAYYHMTLKHCPNDGYIGFGSFFSHPEVELGTGYYIGAYCIIGMSKIGNHTTIGSGVHILSGKKQHGYREIGKPIQEQERIFKTINIGENCWIGNNAVILEDLGQQNVVGAGSVVAIYFGDYVILAGNPSRIISRLSTDTTGIDPK